MCRNVWQGICGISIFATENLLPNTESYPVSTIQTLDELELSQGKAVRQGTGLGSNLIQLKRAIIANIRPLRSV
jgi:hypothetical protein